METHLAIELKKYYTRDNSDKTQKRIFRNGMTQSLMAATISQQLINRNERELAPEVFSKILNSQEGRLFTALQLAIFCDIIDATDDERYSLELALHKDQWERYGLQAVPSVSSHVIAEMFSGYPEFLHNFYLAGQPEAALALTGSISRGLSKALDEIALSKTAQPLSEILVRLLLIQAQARRDMAHSQLAVVATEPFIQQARRIARLNQGQKSQETIEGLADFGLGLAYYIAERYHESMRLLSRAKPTLTSIDDRLSLMRSLALDWAYLGEPKEYRKVASEARSLVNEHGSAHLQAACEALEGLARAETELALPRDQPYKALEQAYHYYSQLKTTSENVALLAVQLKRTEFAARLRLNPTNEVALIETGTQGLHLAEECGYTRYASWFRSRLP